MIPWTLEHFMRVLFGKGTSAESRLPKTLQLNPKRAPDFKTNQKLFLADYLPLDSTYDAYGLGFVHEFIFSQHFEYFCRVDNLESFYLTRIEACKKWMQDLPLHPLFNTRR